MQDASHASFQDLLLRYSQELDPKDRDAVEARLWEGYGHEICTMVADMSGFTRLTEMHGVVHYLSMVRRMQLTVKPIVESYEGSIVKFEADNVFARFASPGSAIRASIALNLAVDSANLLTPDELDIYVACGIDYGRCLFPYPSDYFGGAVNRACKLAEDIGKPGQILVTEQAMERVDPAFGIRSEYVTVRIGHDDVRVHSIRYRSEEQGAAQHG